MPGSWRERQAATLCLVHCSAFPTAFVFHCKSSRNSVLWKEIIDIGVGSKECCQPPLPWGNNL